MMGQRQRTGFIVSFVLVCAITAHGASWSAAVPLAQDAPATPIAYGETATGALDASAPEARYTFAAHQGDVVTITLTGVSGDIDPQLELLDSAGALVNQNDDIDFPNDTNARIADLTIPADGAYTIVVKSFTGTFGEYTLALMSGTNAASLQDGPSLPSPESVSVQGNGALRFMLTWIGSADLDLIVIDPEDNQIYWDTPSAPNGGTLDSSQGNDFCVTISAQPQEIIAWETDAPVGDYTLQVRYSLVCDDAAPVPVTVMVETDGQVAATYEAEVSQEATFDETFSYSGLVAQAAPAVETPAVMTREGALAFVLRWEMGADLDLAVTDPQGNVVSWQVTESPSGGVLDSSQGNDFCAAVSETPQEVVAWAASAPVGEYTFTVTHALPCDASGAVPFTLDVMADGVVVASYTDEVAEEESLGDTVSYVGGAVVEESQATPGAAPDYGPVPVFANGEEVPLIAFGETYDGVIDDQAYSLSGRIAGEPGEVIMITVTATSGDLLPLAALSVEEADGSWTALAAVESQAGEPAVVTYTVTARGWYIVSATRAGADQGATSGEFTLMVERQ